MQFQKYVDLSEKDFISTLKLDDFEGQDIEFVVASSQRMSPPGVSMCLRIRLKILKMK
jgi:hypothetical protein